jgi:hypothetical protein
VLFFKSVHDYFINTVKIEKKNNYAPSWRPASLPAPGPWWMFTTLLLQQLQHGQTMQAKHLNNHPLPKFITGCCPPANTFQQT